MALSEQTQKLVEEKLGDYCNNKIPANIRDQVRLGFTVMGNTVTLFEEKPIQNNLDQRSKLPPKLPLAQFRLNVVDHLWRLYCPSQRRQDGWILYPGAKPTEDFEAFLGVLDKHT
ncbi:MAG: DUF3024 domain-containing protein [Betaproteobacteria bacterium]|nr:DUF3024 domain-containing protein [Betaproteobacteria bacterium]